MTTPKMNALLITALVLLGVRLVLFTAVHFYHQDRTPRFTPIRTTLSEYGTGKGRPVFTAMGVVTLIAYGLIAIVFTGTRVISPPWRILVWVAIICQLMLFFFPVDPLDSGKQSLTGKLHFIFALSGFILFYIFVVAVPINTAWAGSAWLLTWRIFAHIGLWSFFIAILVPFLRVRISGITERIYLMAIPLWFFTCAYYMVH